VSLWLELIILHVIHRKNYFFPLEMHVLVGIVVSREEQEIWALEALLMIDLVILSI